MESNIVIIDYGMGNLQFLATFLHARRKADNLAGYDIEALMLTKLLACGKEQLQADTNTEQRPAGLDIFPDRLDKAAVT